MTACKSGRTKGDVFAVPNQGGVGLLADKAEKGDIRGSYRGQHDWVDQRRVLWRRPGEHSPMPCLAMSNIPTCVVPCKGRMPPPFRRPAQGPQLNNSRRRANLLSFFLRLPAYFALLPAVLFLPGACDDQRDVVLVPAWGTFTKGTTARGRPSSHTRSLHAKDR